jgi:hypothetical protein
VRTREGPVRPRERLVTPESQDRETRKRPRWVEVRVYDDRTYPSPHEDSMAPESHTGTIDGPKSVANLEPRGLEVPREA